MTETVQYIVAVGILVSLFFFVMSVPLHIALSSIRDREQSERSHTIALKAQDLESRQLALIEALIQKGDTKTLELLLDRLKSEREHALDVERERAHNEQIVLAMEMDDENTALQILVDAGWGRAPNTDVEILRSRTIKNQE